MRGGFILWPHEMSAFPIISIPWLSLIEVLSILWVSVISQDLRILPKPMQQGTSQLRLHSEHTIGIPSLASHSQAMGRIA